MPLVALHVKKYIDQEPGAIHLLLQPSSRASELLPHARKDRRCSSSITKPPVRRKSQHLHRLLPSILHSGRDGHDFFSTSGGSSLGRQANSGRATSIFTCDDGGASWRCSNTCHPPATAGEDEREGGGRAPGLITRVCRPWEIAVRTSEPKKKQGVRRAAAWCLVIIG